MKADPKTIANLQAGCALLAHLAEQYRVDAAQLKAMDLDWLSCRVHKWHEGSEHFQEKFIKRLLWLGQDPTYSVAAVSGAASVTALLTRERDAVNGALDQFVAARLAAWNTRADSIPDLFEHVIQELEKQCVKIERELALIAKIGENDYISARLEDA